MATLENEKWMKFASVSCKSDGIMMSVVNICKAIYIPSKQCILLIGGYDAWNVNSSKEIWIYSLSSQKWKEIENVLFEGFCFEAVLSSNGRYIVLLGGGTYNEYRNVEYVNNILVLDMKNDNNWTMKKSSLCCPDSGYCGAIVTNGIDSNNDILVNWFY
eukprot:70599_1